jgi:hypothetical protein
MAEELPQYEEVRQVAHKLIRLGTFDELVRDGVERLYEMSERLCGMFTNTIMGSDERSLGTVRAEMNRWTIRYLEKDLVEFKAAAGTIPSAESIIGSCEITVIGGTSSPAKCYLIKINDHAVWRTGHVPEMTAMHPREARQLPQPQEITPSWILKLLDVAVESRLKAYPRRPAIQ